MAKAKKAKLPMVDAAPPLLLEGGVAFDAAKFEADQHPTPEQAASFWQYVQKDKEPKGINHSDGQHSFSQNLNWQMIHGWNMTAEQKKVANDLTANMHQIPAGTQLTRYDHAEFIDKVLKDIGAAHGYTSYSEKELNDMLAGVKYGENKFVSTSHNNLANLTKDQAFAFNSRSVKITYTTGVATKGVMPGVGPGGDQGEVVLQCGKTPRYTITGVKFTGQGSRPKGGFYVDPNLPQIEVFVSIA